MCTSPKKKNSQSAISNFYFSHDRWILVPHSYTLAMGILELRE